MEANTLQNNKFVMWVEKLYRKMSHNTFYVICLVLLGLPSHIAAFIHFLLNRKNDDYSKKRREIELEFEKNGKRAHLKERVEDSLRNKNEFFGKKMSASAFQKEAKKIEEKQFREMIDHEMTRRPDAKNLKPSSVKESFCTLIKNPLFLVFSLITSLPMYFVILIYSNAYSKYIFERLLMMIFVIFGVTFLVFTILYISPSDPATNVLGDLGTPEQVATFKKMYGLDKPYIVQLWNTFKGVINFNLGKTYIGNEDVVFALSRKFPATLSVTLSSLIIGLTLSIIPGIISAMKQYSAFDYIFMFIALLGISLPNFWLGLILILEFSIKLKWVPATYKVGQLATNIMPAIVVGGDLSATIARMTRSSMLEVKRQDYILTARAKGLSSRDVTIKHILGNAMIPIVTAIGLQIGGLLGGSSVTEKVFNIAGVGSYIVDKQFVPDIPAVLGGVVYIAIIISLVNLIVDIVYTFLDPRIKSKIKNY